MNPQTKQYTHLLLIVVLLLRPAGLLARFRSLGSLRASRAGRRLRRCRGGAVPGRGLRLACCLHGGHCSPGRRHHRLADLEGLGMCQHETHGRRRAPCN
jgi:hypothetical protein